MKGILNTIFFTLCGAQLNGSSTPERSSMPEPERGCCKRPPPEPERGCCRTSSEAGEYCVTQVTEPVNHGEGPHWDHENGVLYYVSISDGQVHRYDPASDTHHSITLPKPVSLVVPVRESTNKFVVSQGKQLAVLTWDWNTGGRRICPIAEVECDMPGNRFNDGKADIHGRLWAGTMGPECSGPELAVPKKGALYRLDRCLSSWKASRQVDNVSISNGMAWSPSNNVFYWVDMPIRTIYQFDYDIRTGAISNRKTAFVMDPRDGYPDGMTIDTDGNLWIACFGNFQVMQVEPRSARVLRRVKIPAGRVSSAAWGGPGLDELYVTTMRHGLTEAERRAQPQAGAVFKVTGLRARGLPAFEVDVNTDC